MTVKVSHTAEVQKFLEEASGLHNDEGSPRAKALIYRILRDSVNIIEDLNVTPEEFWKAVNYLNVAEASTDHPEIFALRVVDKRYTTNFRYGQLNSPFEYEKVRYVYTQARKLQIAE